MARLHIVGLGEIVARVGRTRCGVRNRYADGHVDSTRLLVVGGFLQVSTATGGKSCGGSGTGANGGRWQAGRGCADHRASRLGVLASRGTRHRRGMAAPFKDNRRALRRAGSASSGTAPLDEPRGLRGTDSRRLRAVPGVARAHYRTGLNQGCARPKRAATIGTLLAAVLEQGRGRLALGEIPPVCITSTQDVVKVTEASGALAKQVGYARPHESPCGAGSVHQESGTGRRKSKHLPAKHSSVSMRVRWRRRCLPLQRALGRGQPQQHPTFVRHPTAIGNPFQDVDRGDTAATGHDLADVPLFHADSTTDFCLTGAHIALEESEQGTDVTGSKSGPRLRPEPEIVGDVQCLSVLHTLPPPTQDS